MLCKALGVALAIAASVGFAHGEGAELGVSASVIEIPRITQPVELKDLLHPKSVRELKKIERFVPSESMDGRANAHHTEAYLAHDGNHLLVFFVCSDPKHRLMASTGDLPGSHDRLEVVIDMMGARQRSYVFSANPRGRQQAQEFEDGKYRRDLEQPWRSASELTANGYVLEISIPLSIVQPNYSNPDLRGIWGIRLRRWLGHSHEYLHWPAEPR